jgi:hypothetical protein
MCDQVDGNTVTKEGLLARIALEMCTAMGDIENLPSEAEATAAKFASPQVGLVLHKLVQSMVKLRNSLGKLPCGPEYEFVHILRAKHEELSKMVDEASEKAVMFQKTNVECIVAVSRALVETGEHAALWSAESCPEMSLEQLSTLAEKSIVKLSPTELSKQCRALEEVTLAFKACLQTQLVWPLRSTWRQRAGNMQWGHPSLLPARCRQVDRSGQTS